MEIEPNQDRIFYSGLGTKLIEKTFNVSWDWLMLIVNKIEKLGYEVSIGRISCNIHRILENGKPIVGLVCGDIDNKHSLVYDAVIQFVIWYNKEMLYAEAKEYFKNFSRESLIDWLCKNDPNGIYKDDDSIKEFGNVVSKDVALRIAIKQHSGLE